MLKSLLVGLDGSACADAATELALEWAGKYDALADGIAIIDEASICKPEALPLGGQVYKVIRDEDLLADAEKKIGAFLEKFEERRRTAGVRGEGLKRIGEPFAEIAREAQRFDLVLLGRETHFHFETRRSPGDTLRKILEAAPRPVVAVPEEPSRGRGVLVAYDGGLPAARALQALVAAGLDGLGEIRVLSVDRESREKAAERAGRAVDYLTRRGLHASALPVESAEKPGDFMLEEAERSGAGLLVMGTHGRRRLKEFLFGSVTSQVLEETTVPVLLYH